MKIQRRTLIPAKQLLLDLFDGQEHNVAEFLLRNTYFLSPDRIRRQIETKGSAAWFPACVRKSNEHHKKKNKGDMSTWNGLEVTVCDNTKARLAFGGFSGLVMLGNKQARVRGYHVAYLGTRL